jgi:hypothetical protein
MCGVMLLQRILRRVAIRLGPAIRRRAPGLVLLAVLLVAGAVLLPVPFGSLFGVGSHGVARSAGESAPVEGEPPATAAYLRGQANGDAQLMWSAFSEKSRRGLQQAGGSIARLQSQLDSAREAGVQIKNITYAGSASIPGGRLVFYVIAQTNPGGTEISYEPYTFLLNENGLIDEVH